MKITEAELQRMCDYYKKSLEYYKKAHESTRKAHEDESKAHLETIAELAIKCAALQKTSKELMFAREEILVLRTMNQASLSH
jgi:hypothetical protein